jgi:hypothetical protein
MNRDLLPIANALDNSFEQPDMERVLTAIGLLQEAGEATSPANLGTVLGWAISRVRTALAAADERGLVSKRDASPRRGEQ